MAHTVLIVEDDPNIADLLHLYLEKDGYTTEIAPDGGKAVEKSDRCSGSGAAGCNASGDGRLGGPSNHSSGV